MCNEPMCDCNEFHRQAALLVSGQMTSAVWPLWLAEHMPWTREDAEAMLSDEYLAVLANPQYVQPRAPITGAYQGFEEPDVYDAWHDGCADTNGDPNGGPDRTDGSGYDCGWYASEMGGGCGSRDDDDFTAGQMCCACGGGVGPEFFRIVPDEEEDNKGKEDGDDDEEDGASAPVLDADEEEDGASAPKRAAIAILAAVVTAAAL